MPDAETRIVRAHPERGRTQRFEGVGTSELTRQTIDTARMLALKEIELAKAEAKAEIRSTIRMGVGLGVAGVCLIMTATLFLVAGAFGIALSPIPGWAAVLIVSGIPIVVGGIAGIVGWVSRVKKPMEVTRRSLEEGARWARDVI